MSLAAETRAAVRSRPWLRYALRAGVLNYAAAAESLDVEGDRDAIATALRRFEEDLPGIGADARDVTVRMQSGVRLAGADGDAGSEDGGDTSKSKADPLVSVDGEAILRTGGQLTAITVAGDVDPTALSAVLGRLDAESVVVDAAGVADGRLVVVVPGSDGPNALRLVEDALARVPNG